MSVATRLGTSAFSYQVNVVVLAHLLALLRRLSRQRPRAGERDDGGTGSPDPIDDNRREQPNYRYARPLYQLRTLVQRQACCERAAPAVLDGFLLGHFVNLGAEEFQFACDLLRR